MIDQRGKQIQGTAEEESMHWDELQQRRSKSGDEGNIVLCLGDSFMNEKSRRHNNGGEGRQEVKGG